MKILLSLKIGNYKVLPLVGVIFILYYSFINSVNTDQKTLALLGCLFTVTPMSLYIAKGTFKRYPFYEMILLFYFFENFFCYFFLHQEKFFKIKFQAYESLLLALIGMICFTFGFKIIKISKVSFDFQIHLADKNLNKFYYIVISILIIHQLLPSVLNAIYLSQLAVSFQYFIIPYLFLLIKKYENKIPKPIIFSTILYFSSLFINILLTGFLAPLMVFGSYFIFTYLIFFKKISIRKLALIIPIGVIFLIMSEKKSEYREITTEKKNVSNFDKLIIYRKLITTTSPKSRSKNPYQLSTLERLGNGFVYLSAVIEQSPERVDYMYGETYVAFIYKIIPRFLWPEKPNENLGNGVAHRYNLLREDDFGTSFNFPILAESYANFGIYGVIFGMLILGLLCGYLDSSFNIVYNRISSINFFKASAGLSVLGLVVFQESNFALIFGNILLFPIMFLFINLLFKVKNFK